MGGHHRRTDKGLPVGSFCRTAYTTGGYLCTNFLPYCQDGKKQIQNSLKHKIMFVFGSKETE
jgi:hypothetical protein